MSHRAGRILAFTLTVAVGAAMPAWAHGTTERVSVSSGGAQGNDGSYFDPAISADGRFVAFTSDATNLVPGDTNGAADIFVRDRQTGTTRRVSLELRRRPGQRRQLQPGDLGGRALRRLRLVRHQPGAGRHQRHGRRLRPRPPDGHDRAGERRLGRRPGQWASASARRSRRTGASSPSPRMPATWCRATPTARATSSSATARRARPSGSASSSGGAQGNGCSFEPGALGGRALRRLRLGCHQPGAGRHQRHRATSSSATARRARPGG